jgi:hypothetical protein
MICKFYLTWIYSTSAIVDETHHLNEFNECNDTDDGRIILKLKEKSIVFHLIIYHISITPDCRNGYVLYIEYIILISMIVMHACNTNQVELFDL